MTQTDRNILFYTGDHIREEFGLTWQSDVVFSDYTHVPFRMLQDGMRFTKHMLFLCMNAVPVGKEYEGDDWLDWDLVQICPWESVIHFETPKGEDQVTSVSQDDIVEWLSTLDDADLELPYLHIKTHRVAVIMEGRPHSERSKGGSERIRRIAQRLSPRIKLRIPNPLDGPLEINIEVFTRNKQVLPDVDRLAIPIMDAFKGIIYEDDRQIASLHPRLFKTDSLFVRLECRTEPMALYEIDRIPIGSLFPLSKGIHDYYVIRIGCIG
jgi:Holliday junction resolvase RusA-like endonuclease